MRRPDIPHAGTSGFTLIELLVGLALMGMAASLLLAGLHMAGRAALDLRAGAAGLDEVIAAQRLLRRSIERLRPVVRMDTARPVIDFRGTDGLLFYVAPPADRDAPDALTRFELVRAATGDLILYAARTRQAAVDRRGYDLTGWKPVTLLRGTRSLSIRYRGAPAGGGDRAWLDSWSDRMGLPELIRIRVEFAANDPRRWPDLLIRPRAAIDTCLPAGGTGSCGAEP